MSPWRMRFIWRGHLRLELSCITVNMVSAKFVPLKNVDQTGTLGNLKELYELNGGFYNTSVCVAVDVYVSASCKLHFI